MLLPTKRDLILVAGVVVGMIVYSRFVKPIVDQNF